MTIQVTRTQVAAAKLRIALDRVEGRTTDEWTLRVANAIDADAESDLAEGSQPPSQSPEIAHDHHD